MYGKLNGGIVEYAPVNYETSEGDLIVNFNNSSEIMRSYGYKEIIENKPTCDTSTHTIVIDTITEDDSSIYINYKSEEVISIPTVEERLMAVEEVILNLL